MKTPVEQAPAPLVSDEQIETGANEWREGERGITVMHRLVFSEGADWMRSEYEAALTQMRAERDELVGELRSQIQVYKDRMGEPTHEANCVCGYHRIEALLSKYKNE